MIADTAIDRASFVAVLRTLALAMEPPHPERSCLLYSALGVVLLHRRGIRALVQAGTAMFRYKSAAHDDETGPTHYSYVYDIEQPLSAARMKAGGLPEMHCWIGIPATGELVDVTTCFLPDLTWQSVHEPWTSPAPPDFFWGTAAQLPWDWHYSCDRTATHIALSGIARQYPTIFAELRRASLAA